MKNIPKVLTIIVSLVIATLCFLLFVRCSPADERAEVQRPQVVEETRETRERFDWDAHEREREERWALEEAEAEERRAELVAEHAKNAKARERERRLRRKRARDRMWLLKSPAAIREALWAIPREGGDDAVAGALLRICVSEGGWRTNESLRDCVWIWQTVLNVRSRDCENHVQQAYMDCEDNEETKLSAMRRLSGRVLDETKVRTPRQKFISKLDLSCERPLFFPRGDSWERNLKAPCERMASEVRAIIRLKANRRLTGGASPIAWGGRCEDSRGACDDELACKRGLARIPSKTANAFWCRPGSVGCRSTPDPVCGQFRKAPPAEPTVASSEHEEEEALGG